MEWKAFEGKEDEHNWQIRDTLLKGLTVQLEEGKLEDISISNILKAHLFQILPILHTPRTQLALTASKFLKILISNVVEIEATYVEFIWKDLLKLCGMTKKIIASAGEEVVGALFTRLPPEKILYFVEAGMKERNVTTRERILSTFVSHLQQVNSANWISRHVISELNGLIELCIIDSSPVVRSNGARIFKFVEGISLEGAQAFLNHHFDPSKAKKLRLILSKLDLEGEAKKSTTPLVAKSNDKESSEHIEEVIMSARVVEERFNIDDEISIPMKSMSLIDSPKAINNGSPSFHSRIPIRSPPKLVLSTPFKRYLSTQPTDSPLKVKDLSVEEIISLISFNTHDLEQWKTLLKHVRNNQHLDQSDLFSIEEFIHLQFSNLNDEIITFVGLIIQATATKTLFHESSCYYGQLVLWLSLYFDQNQSIWVTHPFQWNSYITLEQLSSILINSPTKYHSAGIDGLTLACRLRQTYSPIILDNVHRMWNVAVDSSISKSIVIFLTYSRRHLGDQRFFSFLPNISFSHRRLLDAYLSIDS